MANDAFQVVFKRGDTHYIAAEIRTPKDRVELFVHFPWGSRREATLQKESTNITQHGYMLDHISFHEDGTIHSKGRDGRKKLFHFNKLQPGLNVFNMARGRFLPIFVQSYNISTKRRIDEAMKSVVPNLQDARNCWDVTGLDEFSFILISKCGKLHPGRLLENHGLQNLSIIGKPTVLRHIFLVEDKQGLSGGALSSASTDLLIVVVRNILDLTPATIPKEIEQCGPAFITAVCMPPMDMISKMAKHGPCASC
jgi:hypothetical protein